MADTEFVKFKDYAQKQNINDMALLLQIKHGDIPAAVYLKQCEVLACREEAGAHNALGLCYVSGFLKAGDYSPVELDSKFSLLSLFPTSEPHAFMTGWRAEKPYVSDIANDCYSKQWDLKANQPRMDDEGLFFLPLAEERILIATPTGGACALPVKNLNETAFANAVEKNRAFGLSNDGIVCGGDKGMFSIDDMYISTTYQSQHKRHGYSTPWLEVIEETIANFYSNNRTVDPKSDEVTAWITQKAEEKGIQSPGSIAKAVFTICKPTNHNPRKRKEN